MASVRPKVKGGGGKVRQGRGFSRDELEKAGWDVEEAVGYDIVFDGRRKSCHDDNVTELKKLLKEYNEE